MVDEPSNSNKPCKIPLAPAPPVLPNKMQIPERKNILKSAATLLGNDLNNSATKSALNTCEEFLNGQSNAEELSKLRWFYHNNDVIACLQDGPTCGLVALKIAADILKVSKPCNDIPNLLRVAKDNGFTNDGEMFSAHDMGVLAKIFYNLKYKVIHNGLEKYKSLIEHLYQGYPVLVPYDADRNHTPCLKQGHKAHWAVLTGFLLSLQEIPSKKCDNAEMTKINAFRYETTPIQSLEIGNVYLIARQGKSRHYFLCSWLDLHDSNRNLFEFPQYDMEKSNKVIFTDGLDNDLCSKAVYLFPACE